MFKKVRLNESVMESIASEQSKTIGMVLKEIKSSIDKITQSTDNVLQRFEAIDPSIKNRESIDLLGKEVSRFKVE